MTVSIPHDARLSFGGILRSEWIKLVSLRSTVWCYVILVLLTVGLSALLAGLSGVGVPAEDMGSLSYESQQSTWLQTAAVGTNFAQLVIAVLGAMVITGEYGTGMIRSTFAAVPGRIAALVGKIVVFGVVTFLVSFASLVVSAVLTVPLLGANGFDIDVADGNVWLGLVGAAGFVTLIGLMALGIGTIIRNTAGAIAAALGLLLVLPTVLQIFAAVTQIEWLFDAVAFLPSSAGAALTSYPTAPIEYPAGMFVPLTLEPLQALLVLVAWAAAPVILGAVLLKRRDT
ncbi:ABC transporter permease subunit [Pseudolysinimonas sp.]|jgi:ABC-2 type transport system permease protein|uniref:ABC transporter permease subunit n=1 Tax=Pseudolysinimonas sp. TaxID=2680009 RepID=UPI0037833635